MTKTFTVKSNATRAAKKAHPEGDFEVYADGDGWAFRQLFDIGGPAVTVRSELPENSWRKLHKGAAPTAKADADLHDTFKLAYGHFNLTLFDGRLPDCMILIHRKKNARGYFWAEQWKNRTSGEGRHEIAMNPDNFGDRDTKDILSTLVHEMTHLEQQVFGEPSPNGHHNKEWVDLMLAIGLLPYDTKRENKPEWVEGEPNPQPKFQTGTKVSHAIIPDDAFDLSCDTLLSTGVSINWQTHEASAASKALAKKKRASKTKFTCPSCGQNAWAKPDASLGCWDCGVEMEDAGE